MTALDQILERSKGFLPLQPTYARRFYMDGGRLGLSKKPGGTFNPKTKLFTPERWIASSTEAVNPHPIVGEGLSYLDIPGERLSLRDALKVRGEVMLGAQRNKAHGGEFRVLIKILDPYEPIVFHFHAKDEHVRKFPQHFVGHRFGKDEAYYFLEKPKASMPYTHVGLHPDVTLKQLIAAVRKGPDYALELSPVIYQRYEEGFYVPAGIPHRPGSALTLEIQQPSDVYTLLETHAAGRPMSPEQMHPGFPDLDSAFKLIDLKLSRQPDILERYRLTPTLCENGKQRGGVEHWIYPPTMTDKFSGKRLRVQTRFESCESDCYALLVWRGRGKLNGTSLKAGDEFFVTADAASQPHVFENTGNEVLEVFKFFAAAAR
ncbi:MAG: hypothetical protein NZT92_01230 [Abditibacteriales bacterium]|nr:hypothetical protein [Abditibacteriales bacterium]MDW8364538.1 hypothetical protein [Abditibacteriales bacterium]